MEGKDILTVDDYGFALRLLSLNASRHCSCLRLTVPLSGSVVDLHLQVQEHDEHIK